MEMIGITQAEERDLEAVLSLQKLAFGKVAKQIDKYDIPPLLQTIPEIRDDFKTGTILKYTAANHQIIGSVRGWMDEDGICHVGKLIVHPAFQNRGIGKALMYAIEKYFPVCRKFILFTGEDTPHTLYLYSNVGYQVVCKKLMDGVNFIFMEKENLGSTRTMHG